MNILDLQNKLQNNEITVINSDHMIGSVLELINHEISSIHSEMKGCVEKISTLSDSVKINEEQNMYDITQEKLYKQITLGSYVRMWYEPQCQACEQNMRLVLFDENTIGFISNKDYNDKSKTHGYNHKSTISDIKQCVASDLKLAKKLISTISVPSGELVIKNFFNTDEIYKLPKDEEYKGASVQSILGRNKLMQYLASKDVGYGQMGNMSVGVYIKDNTDIIIGNSYVEDRIIDLEATIEELESDDKELDDYKEELKDAYAFSNLIKEYKCLGTISLSVWRWMCIDKSILDSYNEPLVRDEYDHAIVANVTAGQYQIEHIYYFPVNGDYIYSRINLINNI
jgi:hypothetical protein